MQNTCSKLKAGLIHKMRDGRISFDPFPEPSPLSKLTVVSHQRTDLYVEFLKISLKERKGNGFFLRKERHFRLDYKFVTLLIKCCFINTASSHSLDK